MVRLETRPPNLEGEGQVTMRDLVKNCLRMRPERIIVGEVRGPEAFDLLQAMNTGHDGSMGTLHANSPREALSRIESMITMGGYSLPSKTIREMIVRLGRRRGPGRAPARRLAQITHITEVVGLEGDVIITQDLFVYEMTGEDAQGNLIGRTDRPASAGRNSGTAPATTARKSGWPPRSTPPKAPPRRRRDEEPPAMKMQTLALFGMVATAIGGVAYVFIYPLLSGERKAEQRRASVTPRRAGRARDRPRPSRNRAASRSKRR